MAKILELKKVNKIYGKTNPTQALFDVDLSIKKGSFNSIIGSSGSGKSTLLNIMGTLDKPTTGKMMINEQDTNALNKNELAKLRNEQIGFIFQFHYLLPEFTALENVLLPYQIKNYKITSEIKQRAEELLDRVGLKKVMHNLANNLSGGQQQRTAIARALINQPSLILADEPTGNLDSESSENVYRILRNINEGFKTTFVIITHDRKIAEKTDRIIEIKDGRIHLDIEKA